MKKFFTCLLTFLSIILFSGCEVSNTDLANSLEGNMTRLVYSIGYLDSISTEELTGIVNSSSYLTHSSLYTGNVTTENLDNTLNNDTTPLTTSGRTLYKNSSYRLNTYNNSLETANNINNLSTTSSSSATSTVDLSLLETNASDLNEILLDISSKRGIIMLYCTDLRSGRASLSSEAKIALNEYNDINVTKTEK